MTNKSSEESAADKAHYRLKTEMRVYYRGEQNVMLSDFSVDVSAGGLFLKTETELETGEDLTVHFYLPHEGRVFHCDARVAWVNSKEAPEKPELPPGVGVQFINMPLDSIKAIRSFMKHNIVEPRW